jgi:hypothetical protein
LEPVQRCGAHLAGFFELAGGKSDDGLGSFPHPGLGVAPFHGYPVSRDGGVVPMGGGVVGAFANRAGGQRRRGPILDGRLMRLE